MDEIYDCIRRYDTSGNVSYCFPSREMSADIISVPAKNLAFHVIPIPFTGYSDVSPDFFQKHSLEYASRNIQLVHLWQDQWIVNNPIVCSRIQALLGGAMRIHARQTTAKRITKDDMRRFFTDNHLQGFVNARYSYGLFAADSLVAAASFSAGRTVTRNGIVGRSYELLRYASITGRRVVGGGGKLIARFIEDRNPDDIMTYADLDWASGMGYRALNFQQVAVTPPQTFWIHPDDNIRYYPHRLPLGLTEAFDSQTEHIFFDDFMRNKGYIKIYNAGNLKYILALNP